MNYEALIASKQSRFEELEAEIASGELYSDPKRSSAVFKEHSKLKKLLETWETLSKTRSELLENQELLRASDEEMVELARQETLILGEREADLSSQLQLALLPSDPNEERNAIVEIRAGTGGNEAALFAGELYRMYNRYCEMRNWKLEQLELSPSELGGIKEVIFEVCGEDVFRDLRYEMGVHRVQRVPVTETQGRIHTSTATVAVLPEAQEVDLQLNPEEIRITWCRASGPGGQGVNTTDSAVQVMHIPTGEIVRIQDGRSQHKNKEKALSVLRSRLLEKKQTEEAQKYSAQRKNQIGSGGREEKIRTYNFPQNRLTDHRIGLTLYNLEAIMQGTLSEIIEQLKVYDMQERLAEASLQA